MKTKTTILVLLFLLLALVGCVKNKNTVAPLNNSAVESLNVETETLVSEEAARQIAIKKFDEVQKVNAHKRYNITVQEFSNEEDWAVFFRSKGRFGFFTVGDHALVLVNKTTGATRYSPGM